MDFNAEQTAVANHIFAPVLVLAPAGSGKTALLAHRVLGAISDGIPPEEILCLTGWRGATPIEFKERFGADFDPTVYSLPLNYRATITLIHAADSFAAAAFEGRFTQLIPADSCPEGEPIVVHQAETEKDEGEWIGNAIQDMIRSPGMEYKESAILCRSNSKAMQIGAVLGVGSEVPTTTASEIGGPFRGRTGYLPGQREAGGNARAAGMAALV